MVNTDVPAGVGASVVLKALIQALSSSGFLDLQHILLAAL